VKGAGREAGRPPTMPQAVVRRIQRQRARGDSLRKIAKGLNHDGVPTAQGRAWSWPLAERLTSVHRFGRMSKSYV
jgi:hypothetical protein